MNQDYRPEPDRRPDILVRIGQDEYYLSAQDVNAYDYAARSARYFGRVLALSGVVTLTAYAQMTLDQSLHPFLGLFIIFCVLTFGWFVGWAVFAVSARHKRSKLTRSLYGADHQ